MDLEPQYARRSREKRALMQLGLEGFSLKPDEGYTWRDVADVTAVRAFLTAVAASGPSLFPLPCGGEREGGGGGGG
jgi:hypothetical protein